jgi:hypothetical protein
VRGSTLTPCTSSCLSCHGAPVRPVAFGLLLCWLDGPSAIPLVG